MRINTIEDVRFTVKDHFDLYHFRGKWRLKAKRLDRSPWTTRMDECSLRSETGGGLLCHVFSPCGSERKHVGSSGSPPTLK